MARLLSVTALLLLTLSFTPWTAAQASTASAPIASYPCLSYGEAYNIALRWLQIFQTDLNGTGTGSAIIPSTLTSNFTYYDLGATFNDPTPIYNSSQAVFDSVTGSGYSGALVTNVTYSIVEAFASCDTAVVRWQSDSLSANATNVTVTEGTPITYRGTDYLRVDLETRLIYNSTSSSDLLNYYIQLGDDVIAAQAPSAAGNGSSAAAAAAVKRWYA